MPTLLPRKSMDATSVISASIKRPSPSDHRVGASVTIQRMLKMINGTRMTLIKNQKYFEKTCVNLSYPCRLEAPTFGIRILFLFSLNSYAPLIRLRSYS